MKMILRSFRCVLDFAIDLFVGGFFAAAALAIIFFGMVIVKLFIDRVVDIYLFVYSYF